MTFSMQRCNIFHDSIQYATPCVDISILHCMLDVLNQQNSSEWPHF